MICVITKKLQVLYMQTVSQISAGPGVTIWNASKQNVHGKFYFVSKKTNTLAIEMNLAKQFIYPWEITEVSNSTK